MLERDIRRLEEVGKGKRKKAGNRVMPLQTLREKESKNQLKVIKERLSEDESQSNDEDIEYLGGYKNYK